MTELISFRLITAEVIISCAGFLLLLMAVIRTLRPFIIPLSIGGILAAMLASLYQWNMPGVGFSGMVARDQLSIILNVVFLTGTLFSIFLSLNFVRERPGVAAEYFSLLYFATLGMMLMASTYNLIIIFLGLEVLSMSLYILTGFRRTFDLSLEAALKYFLLGAFASGFLLYGIAFIFGAAGTMDLRQIAELISAGRIGHSTFFYTGLGLLIVGFGFKVALVPFHMWTPDVYEGAATPVTAFMSVGAKGAGFAVVCRIFFQTVTPLHDEWVGLLWVLAVLTMTVGNIGALAQSNIKRMLAYSSIAHAGYLLIAVTTGDPAGFSAVIYYLLAYTFMNLGAFGVVIALEKSSEDELLNIDHYAGLGFKKPYLGLAMLIALMSLAGIPPTAGFLGKFFVFSVAVKNGFYGLAVIGALNAVVAVYYYLRIVVIMYMREPVVDFQAIPRKPILYCAVLCSVAGILYLGLNPDSINHWLNPGSTVFSFLPF